MSSDRDQLSVLLYIQGLKSYFAVKKDDDLADKLGLSKQAISNWRTRASVPLRLQQKMLDLYGIAYVEWDYTFEGGKGDVIYAVALYAYEQHIKMHGAPANMGERRSFGQIFPTVLRTISSRLDGITTRRDSAETLISFLKSAIDNGEFPEVHRAFTSAMDEAG